MSFNISAGLKRGALPVWCRLFKWRTNTVSQVMKKTNTPSGPGVSPHQKRVDGIPQTLQSAHASAAVVAVAVTNQFVEMASATVMPASACAEAGTHFCNSAPASGKSESVFPEVSLEHTDPGDDTRTRRGIIETKRKLESPRALTFKETRSLSAGAEKSALYAEIRAHADEAARLERHLQENFVPL